MNAFEHSHSAELVEANLPGASRAGEKTESYNAYAALNFSAYCVRSSANHDGSTGRCHRRVNASSG